MSLFELERSIYVEVIELLELVVFKRKLQYPDIVKLQTGCHPLIELRFSPCGEYMDIEWRTHA